MPSQSKNETTKMTDHEDLSEQLVWDRFHAETVVRGRDYTRSSVPTQRALEEIHGSSQQRGMLDMEPIGFSTSIEDEDLRPAIDLS